MGKYSYNQLETYRNDINNFIETEDKLDNALLFKLRKNLRKIKEGLEIIEEDMKRLNKEETVKFQEFNQKRVNLFQKYGGTVKNDKLTNMETVAINSEFQKEANELVKEYQEVIDKLKEYDSYNEERKQEKVAEIELIQIPLSLFPKEVSDAFTDSFLDFVNEDGE